MLEYSRNRLPENELLAIFDNAAIVLILVDREGRVVRINRAGSELVGAGNEKVMGLLAGEALRCVNLHENINAVCGCTEECARCDLRNLFSQVFSTSIDIEKQEGSITVVRDGIPFTYKLLISANRVVIEQNPYVLLTIDDITRQKEQEQMLRKLVETRDKLFSVIAHDLKSPLSVIIGFADYMVANFDSVDKEQIKTFLEHIQQSSHDAYNLLDNLFEWTSNQWNKTSMIPKAVKVGDMCNEVLDFCRSMAKGKEVRVELADHYSGFWVLDEDMIKTTLRNLVINSIKFTNRGGVVQIETTKNGNALRFIVSDTGIGICKEALESLFEGNGNGSSSGTESEKGSGLGLLICKEFVEKHGSQLEVASEVGKGTSISFSIPSAK
ncbi:PAS domain-containing sensor histidine kinase [Natronoflexus pectinivorans]|uniref:histidine kinase n=1 Tax=Natronoflexus pectinivorans TaxID=682526 RepID=A0A4R2GF43_9BACT|nr:PAS domain-containing sensor histidine kinase [Natronoflexus pectinivorans]TCO06828.1 PAS domain S-box-containing protein [Natronoflexus pectinivorans]